MEKGIKGVRLSVLTDSNEFRSHEEVARAAIEGGAQAIQLRTKRESTREALEIGKRIKAMCKGKALFIVNDRLDLAMALGADGLHLGQEDMPIESVKELSEKSGKELIIGLSTHSLEQAMDAEKRKPHYISFGPIFPSRTKPSLIPVGTEKLKNVCKKVNIPIIAIGGINRDNVEEVMRAGVQGVAAVSAISEATDPKRAAQELFKKINATINEAL